MAALLEMQEGNAYWRTASLQTRLFGLPLLPFQESDSCMDILQQNILQGYLNLLWKKRSGWGNSHLVVEATAIQLRNSNIKFLLVRSESSDTEDSKFHQIQIFTPNPPNIHWEECSSKKPGFKTLLIIHSSISMLQFYTNTAGISASKAKLLLLIYAMTNLRNTQSQIMIMNLSCAASSLR